MQLSSILKNTSISWSLKNLNSMKPFIALLIAIPFSLFAQNQESELQKILEKLDAGESVENMSINLGDINFATGTANLEAGAKTYLTQVVKLLKAAPNLNLSIKGHADNTGTAAVNDKLSLGRATAVMDFLIGMEIAPDRLQASGFGSSMPVADNASPEGRAKNRRVEMEILRKAEAKTIQDIIVLRDGSTIGTSVRNYDDWEIIHVQFAHDEQQSIATYRVERILFADGREVVFNAPADSSTPPPAVATRKARTSFRPFAESEAFHKGQFFLGLGYGIKNNIGITYKDNQVSLPPCMLILEIPLGYNFGAGFSAGAMMWKPEGSTGSYGYFALSPRLAYHVNLGSKLDLYGGASLNTRLGTLQSEVAGGGSKSLSNFKFNASFFGGARYYFGSFFGLFAEYGGDSVSCAKAGLAFHFGK